MVRREILTSFSLTTVQNVTGWFVLSGDSSIPFVFRVQTVQDGRSYCTRTVNATQAEGKGICFTCTCSFKRPEDGRVDLQETVNLEKQYDVVLSGKKPEDWEEAPGVGAPWYVTNAIEAQIKRRKLNFVSRYHARRKATGHNDAFPGLESRKVDMTPYNASRSPLDRRQLFFYRVIGDLPPDANMHACAHLYASDRNSLFCVADFLDVGEKFTHMGSLSHTVVFHCPVPQMLLQDAQTGEKAWMCQEVWTTRAAVGRATHNSRLIGPGGVHVASTSQEGMLRVGIGENKFEKAYKEYVKSRTRERL